MSRILVLAVIAVMFVAAPLAADQALQNPDLEPNTTADEQNQTAIAETSADTFEAVIPISMFAIVVGTILVGVRSFRSGGGL